MIRTIFWSLLVLPFCAFADGDVDGGGGGTTNPDPVPEYKIVALIQHDAKRDLRMYLKNELRSYEEKFASPLEKKLFGGHRTLLDVLEETDIDVRMDQPCFDKFGREVDGSIYSHYANSICISVHRIAPKLIEERMRVETLALILHELTHLMGANEEEARAYQRSAAFDMRGGSSEETEKAVIILNEKVRFLTNEIGRLRAAVLAGDKTKLNASVRQASLLMTEMHSAVLGHPYSPYDKREFDFFSYNWARLHVGLMVAETLDSQDEHDSSIEYLNQLFRGKTEITYAEYLANDPPVIDTTIFGHLPVRRSGNASDLDKELAAVEAYFDTQEDYFFRFRYDNPLRRFADPTATMVNPWAKFVGNYKVVNAECKLDGYQSIRYDRVTKIEIGRYKEEGKPETFWMRDEWSNGSATDSLDENRYDMGGYIQVDFLEQGARKRSGQRSPWNDRSSNMTFTMTELENEKFTLDIALRGKDWSAYGRVDSKADCHLVLTKE